MNYALKTLEEIIANRRNQILFWQTQIKKAKGGNRISAANWESHITKCQDEIQQCESAIDCIAIMQGMYERRTKGLTANDTTFPEYLKKWISNEG